MVPFLLPMAIVVFALVAVALVLFLFGYQVARPGMALIVARPNSPARVLFEGGAFSLPKHAQLLDLMPRTVNVDFAGDEALRFSDGRAEARLEIRLSPNRSASDVLAISSSLGAAVANDPAELGRRLEPKLREVTLRCAASRGVASLLDSSLAGELRTSLGSSLDGFAVDACDLARSS